MQDAGIRVGTSGWSYPSGAGTWNGLFYPLRPDAGSARRFDELAYYARFFDTVEVNSTFYRQPVPHTTRSWVSRTPSQFEFSVKLFQKLTHPMRVGRGGPPDAEAGVRGRSASDEPDGAPPQSLPDGHPADVDEFRRGIDPIASAGRLGAVLVQFPPGFRNTPEARDYLGWLLGALAGYQVAVELRHRSWSDDSPRVLGLLDEAGAAWVQIDEPKFRFSIRQTFRPNVAGCYYMRLHGRNAAQWWRHEHPEDRYNYLYSADELKPLAEAAADARPSVRKAYLYLNNHFAAKAVVNATVLKHQLGLAITGEFPPELVRAYPEIEPIVTVRADGPPGRLPWDTRR